MRSIRLTVLLAALLAVPVQGQLEFSGGMNLSEMSGALGGGSLQDVANRAGMVFGVDLVLPLGGMGLNLGADWSQKGMEDIITDPATAQAVTRLIDLEYIEVPVHLRIPLVSGGLTTVNLVLGPTFGFRTGCDVSAGLEAAQACADLAGGPDLKSSDVGGTAGLGLSFSLGGLAYLGLDVRYTMGMTSVNTLSTESLKNRTLSVQSHFGLDLF